MKSHLLVVGIISVIASGCMTTKMPTNAGEFREAMKKDAYYAKHESYEVAVPLMTIANNFSQLGPKCFNGTVKATGSNAAGRVSIHKTHYKATTLHGKGRAELHVQSYHEGDQTFVNMPKDGIYKVVADATQINNKKTRITLYYGKLDGEHLVNAIKNWTRNKGLGCPDLTK